MKLATQRNLALSAIAVVLLACSMQSCKQEQKKERSNMTRFEEAMTNQDSLMVKDAIDNFFNLVEAGDVTTAVRSLYRLDADNPDYDPQPLDNEELAQVEALFKAFPFKSHRIDYMKYRYNDDNEVKVTAVFANPTDSQSEGTTCFYFKPVEVLGNWILCLANSATGDMTIVSNEEKDSLEKLYKEQSQHLVQTTDTMAE